MVRPGYTTDPIRIQAEDELAQEAHREAVEREKTRLRARRARPWWRRLIPFTIRIERTDR